MINGAVPMVLAAITALLGLYMIVAALVGGGGVQSYGVLVGPLFLAAGAGRVWILVKPVPSA